MTQPDQKQQQLLAEWYELKKRKSELDKQLKTLEDQLDGLKRQIASEVFHNQPGTVQFADEVIKYAIIEATRIDTTKFKTQMPNLAAKFTVTYTYDTLTILTTTQQ